MIDSVAAYRNRLRDAGYPGRNQLTAFGTLGLKVGSMFARGVMLAPRLKVCSGVPLVGRAVRVRDAAQLSVGHRLILEDYVEVQATSQGGIILGDDVSIGAMTMIRPSGYYSRPLGVGMVVGNRVGINAYCYFGCSGGITIGNDVLFGPGVMLFAEEHNFDDLDPIRQQGVERAPIVIEDDCWLASGVKVTAGVHIGRGSVIGAGSVVTRDLPPWSVAAGNPARILRMRELQ